MKMKKFLSLALAMTMMASIAIPVSATTEAEGFLDVPTNHWSYSFVTAMAQKGYINGTGGSFADGTGTFNPSGTVSNAEFCTLLARPFLGEPLALQLEHYGEAKGFPWWKPYAMTMLEASYGANQKSLLYGTAFYKTYESSGYIMTGDMAGAPITRGDMAVVIYNLFKYCGVRDMLDYREAAEWGPDNISDWWDISGIREEVANIYKLGIITGRGSSATNEAGAFDANGTLTRAEVATVLYRLCETNLIPEISYNSATGQVVMEEAFGLLPPEVVTPPTTTPEATKPGEALEPHQYDISVYDVPADTNKDGFVDEAEVISMLDELEQEFPTGTSWGEDKSYYSKVFRATGTGCAAYAFMISDRVFGNLPVRDVTAEYTGWDIQAGDIVYDSFPHWGVYTDRLEGRYMTNTQGNVGGEVTWGGWEDCELIRDALDTGNFKLYTRYPA